MDTIDDTLHKVRLALEATKGAIKIFDSDSEREKTIKVEIQSIRDALNSGVQDKIVSANSQACNKFPELFNFAPKNDLIQMRYEVFIKYSFSYHITSLETVMKAMFDLLHSEQLQDKLPKIAIEAGKIDSDLMRIDKQQR